MKKYISLALMVGLILPLTAQAQVFETEDNPEVVEFFAEPNTIAPQMDVALEVLNVSNKNQDASVVGVRPGDVMRFRLSLGSRDFDALSLQPMVDVSELIQVAQLIDTGFANEENGMLVYPAFSEIAPYDNDFAFFARVGGSCNNIEALTIRSMGQDVVVPLICEKEGPETKPTPLTKTGPQAMGWFLLLVGIIGLGRMIRRKHNA